MFAQVTDLDWIKQIADAHRKELSFITKGTLAKAIEDQEIICVPYQGFLHFHYRKDKVATLYHLCVAEKYQGVGRKLIKLWESDSLKNGITTLRLKCPINLDANGFYQKNGFDCVEIQPGRNRSLVLWEKSLINL